VAGHRGRAGQRMGAHQLPCVQGREANGVRPPARGGRVVAAQAFQDATP